MITPVVFRVWKDAGTVLALFPNDREGSCYVSSYEHVGQHSGADYALCIGATRRALPREYADLASELTRIGYRLKVYKRKPVRR